MASFESIQNKYLDGSPVSHCSDATKMKVDNAVIDLLKKSYEKAMSLLKDNRAALDKISEFLIEKETITGDEFMDIFRKQKIDEESAEQADENPAETKETD